MHLRYRAAPHHAQHLVATQAVFFNWIMNFVVAQTFLDLCNALHKSGAFALYAGLSVVAFTWIFYYIPETKGLSLDEIISLFAQPTPGLVAMRKMRNRDEATGLTKSGSKADYGLLKPQP